MLIIESITIKNFMSVGNHPITIDYTKHPSTLVSAKNGSGKSVVFLDALAFVLFDRPYRKGRKGQLVNDINGKETMVELRFSVANNKFHLRRGIKPNVFEIFKNGELLNQPDSVKDYQKILERQILRMNFKTFSQVMIMGSGNYVPFMRLDAAGRREFIEDLLDIKVFSVMNMILKKKIKDTKAESELCKLQFSTVQEKYRTVKQYLDKLKKDKEDEEARVGSENAKIEAEISKIGMILEPYYLEISGFNPDSIRLAKEKLAELSFKITEAKKQINGLVEKRLKIKEGDTCPVCGTVIDREHLGNMTHEIQAEIDVIQARVDKMTASKERGTKVVWDLEAKLADYDAATKTIREGEARIKALKYALESLVKTADSDRIQKEEEALEAIKAEAKVIQEKMKTIEVEMKAQEHMLGLLKDTGIKSKIVKQYIPVLNHFVNHFLQRLGFKIQFEMAEDFTETVKSAGAGTTGYDMFSEGEKQRVDLAIMFAFREVARLKNSVNTNLLIMDEILDMSLDEVGVTNFFSIIGEMEDTNLFVISHREGMQDRFDGGLKLTKKNNFTCLIG